MESLGRLAGKVAHDFNNMLGVIVNYANFVVEEASSPNPDISSIAADAQQIVQATERGTSLTQQLLAFASRSVVQPSAVDLNALIASALSSGLAGPPGSPSFGLPGRPPSGLSGSFGPSASAAPPGIEFQPGSDLPPVIGDPAQLARLIGNIVESFGGAIVMSTGRDGDRVSLQATDPGKELTVSEVERAFEPFASIGGSGFGLAMAYGIVMQAGGEIGIESSLGGGTTVTVLLPASSSSS
jgi:two-component system cell cycle sensor histidine kinase/response regulator CckA